MISKFFIQITFVIISIFSASAVFLIPPTNMAIVYIDLPIYYNVRSTTQEPFPLIQPSKIESMVFRTDCLQLSATSSDAFNNYRPKDVGGEGWLAIKSVRGANSVHVIFTKLYKDDFVLSKFVSCLKNEVDAVADIAKSSGLTELIPSKVTLEANIQTKIKWPFALIIFISIFCFLNIVSGGIRFYRKKT